MWVRVIRVATIPGGLSQFVDDQPDGTVIWVLEDECSAQFAKFLEAGLDALSVHWARREGVDIRTALRAVLRAV